MKTELVELKTNQINVDEVMLSYQRYGGVLLSTDIPQCHHMYYKPKEMSLFTKPDGSKGIMVQTKNGTYSDILYYKTITYQVSMTTTGE